MFYDETYVSDTRIYCKKENNEEIDSDDEEMLEQREDERKVKAEIMALLEKRLKAQMKTKLAKTYRMRPDPVNTGS